MNEILKRWWVNGTFGAKVESLETAPLLAYPDFGTQKAEGKSWQNAYYTFYLNCSLIDLWADKVKSSSFAEYHDAAEDVEITTGLALKYSTG